MPDETATPPLASDAGRREQDPRWVRTREAIVRAGFKLFSQHLPQGVGMDELVREAGVSRQSFYNHFADKDDLARHVLGLARAQIDHQVTDANVGVGDAAQRLAVGLCQYVKLLIDDPEKGWVIARLGTEGLADAEMNRPLAGDVREGLSTGRLACFSPETGIAFVVGSALSLGWRVLLDGSEANAPLITQQFVTLILRAFGLPPIEAELLASQAVERTLRARPKPAAAAARDRGRA